MHTLRLKLKTTEADEYNIERRFRAISRVHNILVRECIRRLNRLKQDMDYRTAKAEYAQILQKNDRNADDELRLRELGSIINDCVQKCGLNRSALFAYIKPAQKKYKKLITSQQVQKECLRVLKGVEEFEIYVKKERKIYGKRI